MASIKWYNLNITGNVKKWIDGRGRAQFSFDLNINSMALSLLTTWVGNGFSGAFQYNLVPIIDGGMI